MRGKPWKVRVKRLIEDWVDVNAHTAREAEDLARVLPGVSFVYAPSAVPADKVAEKGPAIGVEEDFR